jgi:hypothetical protein
VSQFSVDQERRKNAELCVRNAILALNSAGMYLVRGRDWYPEGAQELATALRDDITTMVGDAEALLAVTQGR